MNYDSAHCSRIATIICCRQFPEDIFMQATISSNNRMQIMREKILMKQLKKMFNRKFPQVNTAFRTFNDAYPICL